MKILRTILVAAVSLAAQATLSFPAAADGICTDLHGQKKQTPSIAVPAAYQQPDLMAIGDSLTNGVTSLSISRFRAAYSIPSLVALAIDNKHAVSDRRYQGAIYPITNSGEVPVLLDFERELHKNQIALLSDAVGDIETNVRWWVNDYPQYAAATKPPIFFDNVSVAQASSAGLLLCTAEDGRQWKAAQDPANAMTELPHWYYAINLSFVLNPSGVPDAEHLSQMGEVIARKPKRLIINIGSNDLIWQMAFEGRPAGDPSDLVANMQDIAQLIPAETAHVYVINLVPPSRTPNLKPTAGSPNDLMCSDDPADPSRKHPYFRRYRLYLSDRGLVSVDGKTACQMDQDAHAANMAIQKIMSESVQKGVDIRFIDVYDLLMTSCDYKHAGKTCIGPIDWNGNREVLNNLVVHHAQHEHALSSGGVAGYDNMHPTYPVYALVANLIGAEMEKDGALLPGEKFTALDPVKIAEQIAVGHYPDGSNPDNRRGGYPSALGMSQYEDFNLGAAHDVLNIIGGAKTALPADRTSVGCLVAALQVVGASVDANFPPPHFSATECRSTIAAIMHPIHH
jgi:hypothetical protein